MIRVGFVVLIFIFFSFSCRNKIIRITPIEPSNYSYSSDSIYLYFLGGFNSDNINIKYGTTSFLKSNVTTDESLGLALIEVLPFHKSDSICIKRQNPNNVLYIATPDTINNHIEIWYDYNANRLRYNLNDKPLRLE